MHADQNFLCTCSMKMFVTPNDTKIMKRSLVFCHWNYLDWRVNDYLLLILPLVPTNYHLLGEMLQANVLPTVCSLLASPTSILSIIFPSCRHV